MLRKLRIKLVCIHMVFLMGMLCVILGLVFQFTRTNLETESIRMMQSVAARPFGSKGGHNFPEEIHLPYFAVRIDREGRVTATGGEFYDLPDEDFLQAVIEEALSSQKSSGVLEAYRLRFLVAAAPQGLCIVFADVSSELATLRHLTQTCIWAGCLSFAGFLLLSFFLAHWAVKPVERTWARQKQFVADASHELKTPLTVIMTNAEMLQNPACTAEARRKFSGHILTMSHQMRGLVEGMLELARMDSGTAGGVISEVDFSRLVSDALLPFEAVFFEKGLALTEEIENSIAVRGDPSQLRQVMDILLDNAQKYAASSGEVAVCLQRKGRTRCLLSVSNPGEEIPPEELQNIFKRFYRLDKARSMNRSYGLGLSIAQNIVEGHHGRIWAESGGDVNTFRVDLPALCAEGGRRP